MKYALLSPQTDHQTYALRLELGEDIHETIQQFCADHDIANATIEGIGSVESPTLAHYSIRTKQYTDRRIDGIFEVTSLLGNVALVDDKPFAHLHINVAGPDFQAYGGHLVSGKCSATLELMVKSYPSHYSKAHEDIIGLKVWEFDTP